MISRRQRIQQHYEARIDPQRESYEILDWAQRHDQQARFRVLVEGLTGRHIDCADGKPLPLPPPWPQRQPLDPQTRLLDVGCGLTDLAEFLHSCGMQPEYVGLDITGGILQEARRRYGRRELVMADIFSANPFQAQSFDVVYASGIFNLQLGNNDRFLAQALTTLFAVTRGCLVLNLLHDRCPQKYQHCHYYNPAKVLDIVHQLTAAAWITDHYLENDFTVFAWRHNIGGSTA